MRNLTFIILAVATTFACSKKEEAAPTTTTSATPPTTATAPAATTAAAAATTAAPAAVEVSPEMQGFLAMLDGSDKGASKALKKYAVPAMQNNDLGMYTLKNPKVTKSEKVGVMQCYTFESEAGVMKHESKVCWDSKGKIAQITDKSS